LTAEGWSPWVDETLTIAPPVSASSGSAARQARTAESFLRRKLAEVPASPRILGVARRAL
jgi:hypothetical protein